MDSLACAVCGKPSCLPEGYSPLCSRHYIERLNEIDKAQQRRLAAVKKALAAGKRDEALAILHTPLSEFFRK